MEEIKKQLEEQHKEDNAVPWFCPQINANCNHACYCFIPAKIKTDNNHNSKPYISPAFCIHVLHQEQPEIYATINH